MRPNLQETADFVKFTEEILNGRLHFLCSDISKTEIKQKTDYIKKKIRLKYQLHTEKIWYCTLAIPFDTYILIHTDKINEQNTKITNKNTNPQENQLD